MIKTCVDNIIILIYIKLKNISTWYSMKLCMGLTFIIAKNFVTEDSIFCWTWGIFCLCSVAPNTVLVMRYVMDVFLFVRFHMYTYWWFWWTYWPFRDSFLCGTGCTLKLQCTGCRKSIQKLLYFLQPHPGKLILSFPLILQRATCSALRASNVDFTIFLCTFTVSDPPGSHLTEV